MKTNLLRDRETGELFISSSSSEHVSQLDWVGPIDLELVSFDVSSSSSRWHVSLTSWRPGAGPDSNRSLIDFTDRLLTTLRL